MQIVQTAVLTIGFFVSVIQLYLLRVQLRSQHDWNRRSATFSSSINQNHNLQSAKERIRSALSTNGVLVGQLDLAHLRSLSNSRELENDIVYLLNNLEEVCIGVHNGVFDEQAAYDIHHATIIRWSNFFEPWIQEARARVAPLHVYRFLDIYVKKWTHHSVKDRPVTG